MEFDEYSKKITATKSYKSVLENIDAGSTAREAVRLAYLVLGMCTEANVAAQKTRKLFKEYPDSADDPFVRVAIAMCLGDVLCYINMIANEIGMGLSEVADISARKMDLRDRTDATDKLGGNNAKEDSEH
jgi:hypothetical protein